MSVLIGQSRAEAQLARAVAADRVGQAYLFLGPAGTGKATAARLFAQAMNCSGALGVGQATEGSGFRVQGSGSDSSQQSVFSSQSEPSTINDQPSTRSTPTHPHTQTPTQLSPCGVCESCRRIAAGTHPEVQEIRPESKTKQNITVEQAREIRMNAALRPKMGRRRVYLIPNAEAFNEESANALLKTLEEPSPGVTLILGAPSPSQVLPTIRSRCQLVRFGLSDPREIAAALVERGTEPELARALARASGGRPGLALAWAREPAVLARRARILDLFAAALDAQRKAGRDPAVGVLSLRLAEQLRKLASAEKGDEDEPARPAKVQHADDLETGLTLLRDLMLLTRGAEPDLSQNQDRLPALMEWARDGDPDRVLADIEAVRQAQQLLDRNVSPQLVFERMFWSLIGIPHSG